MNFPKVLNAWYPEIQPLFPKMCSVYFFSGSAEDVTGLPDTELETWTIEYMMGAWASFVNDPVIGLSGAKFWLRYDEASETTLVRLGFGMDPASSFVSPRVWDAACPSNEGVAEAQGAF